MSTYPTYKLGEIARSTKGKKPKTISKEKTNGFEIPYVDIKAFEKGIIDNYTDGENCTFCTPDDVLIVWDGARCGFVGRGIEGAIGSTLAKISSEEYINDYLFYFLQSKYKVLNSNPRGVGIPHIEPNLLWNFEIPDIDKTTQHQIVSRIESLFAELDKAVEHLRTAQQQLKTYRQTVLKNAFEECGEMRKIMELSSVVTSGSRGWAKYYTDKKDARFVRITDLTRDKITLQNNNIQYISLPQNVEGKRSLLQPNDVLVSITADLGSIALVPSNIGEAYINQHIAMIRFKNSKQGKFMAYYLRSDYGQRSLLKNKRGGGKLGLGLDDIRNTYIPFVNDEEANEIVLKIETCLSQAEAAETRIAEALQKTEALRQSILKKAFSGELV
jgi:type I restriction enzyme S subunit